MKISDKIVLYLDGQMAPDEKAAFEKELNASALLREELNFVKNFNSGIKELKNIPAEEDYFSQMIPKFRGRMEHKEKSRMFPGIAYGITTATAVLIVMFFIFNRNSNNIAIPVQNTQVHNLNFESVQEASSSFSDQFDFVNMNKEDAANYDTLLNSMLVHELDLTPQSLSEISATDNTTDIQTILQGVNQKEVDDIYKEILHKKIL